MEQHIINAHGLERALMLLKDYMSNRGQPETATATKDGLMSSSDKAKLDKYPSDPTELCVDQNGLTLRQKRIEYTYDNNELKHVTEHIKEGCLSIPKPNGSRLYDEAMFADSSFAPISSQLFPDREQCTPAEIESELDSIDCFKPIESRLM